LKVPRQRASSTLPIFVFSFLLRKHRERASQLTGKSAQPAVVEERQKVGQRAKK
jgi:hypothetical protein